MNSASNNMRPKPSALARRYQASLRRYIEQGSQASVRPAIRLGRQALRMGLETLDLALIHEKALAVLALPIGSSAAWNRIIRRAGAFFAEAILPMEQTHRSALEANLRLSRLNRRLDRRTLDLAASNRGLKKEIAQRKAVEKTLRQSEQHSGRLLGQSRRLQKELRQLSRGILLAQEEERKRISRELHDVIAQVLTSINVRLAVLKTESMANTSGLTKNITQTQRLVEKSVDIVHQFAYDLRPAVLDHLGLIPALDSFMTSFRKKTGIRVRLTVPAKVEELSSAKRTVLYRVVQEALANVVRHAHAGRVKVAIQRLPNAVGMDISDNGRGFEMSRVLLGGRCKRLGLIGIRERVEMVDGQFTVQSAPGRGTAIRVLIPFDNGAREGACP